MPRVASESSVLHSKPHHHLGQRSRAADAAAKSPFAALVESADAPPPKNRGQNRGENRSERTQTNRTSTADETPPTDRCAPAPDRPKAEKTTDEADTDTAEVPADAKAAPTGEIPPEDVAVQCEEQIETVDAFEAAVVVAAATGDANLAQPAPSQAVAPPAAPVAPVVPLAAEPPPAEQAGDDEGVVDLTAGAGKKAPAAEIPLVEPQGADVPKDASDENAAGADKGTADKGTADQAGADKAATATAAGKADEPAPTADAPAPDHQNAAVVESGKTPAPSEPPRSDNPRFVHEHDRAHRGDVRKADDVPHQPLGAQVSDAAQSARPPSEAVHAVLQAADRAAGTAAATAPAATQASLDPPVPIAGLAVEIAARAQSGRNRFEIRLDPPELGRIDVRLDVDTSGQVTSRLVVDRPETLEHLRRDAAELQRALQDAGLKTADNSLQFTLRDQGFAGRDDRNAAPGSARLVVPDADLGSVEAAQSAYGRMVRAGGIDIRV